MVVVMDDLESVSGEGKNDDGDEGGGEWWCGDEMGGDR